MSTIRTHKKERFSVIDNKPINDNSLSWGARGILIYLLSKPDNWQIRATDLIKQGKEGKSAVYARLTELENAGYLHREQIRDNKGRISWVSHIYEIPDYNPHFQPVTENREMDKPFPDFPELDNPDTDNRTVISTDILNTEELNTVSSTNVEDATQKTIPKNGNHPIKEKEQKAVSPAQPGPSVSPPPVKPKTIIKDRFCELTKRKMPNNKKQSGYWWSQFGELLYIANDDYELACKALEEVVPYMRAHNLSISGPQSVIGLCSEVISGQKLNGHTITTEIAPGQDEKWSGLF